jgi:tol-pal system protein YbgF
MSSNALHLRAMVGLIPVLVILVAMTVAGCGSSEESMEEWTEQPAAEAAPPAMLEYRVDSLKNENGRMREQLDAVAAENRKLTARNAELETKISEAATAPAVEAPLATPTHGNAAATGEGALSNYEAALSKFRARDFEGAIADMEALLSNNIEQKYADNCQYWIGESYYGLKKYGEALRQFQTVLGLPRSEKKADAMLMSGNCEAMLGNKAAAKEAYGKVVSDFPTSPLVEKAKEKLAKMK